MEGYKPTPIEPKDVVDACLYEEETNATIVTATDKDSTECYKPVTGPCLCTGTDEVRFDNEKETEKVCLIP
jgi:hypothetical protein